MTEYTTEYEKYLTILEKHNQLMVRLICVTDETLREMLHEEYMDAVQQLSMAEITYKKLEPAYLKHIGGELLSEFMSFYDRQFEPDTMDNIIKLQGFNLSEYVKFNRMRPIYALDQKRELTILLNDLHKQLKIIDYHGNVVDVYGKYTDTNPFIIRCRGFVNINVDLSYCVKNL